MRLCILLSISCHEEMAMSFGRQHGSDPVVEQWGRIKRWQRRLHDCVKGNGDSDDVVDYALVLILNCFAMRDWLINSKAIPQVAVDSIFSSFELKMCRDIAIGNKHYSVNSQSIDSDHRIHREYVPYSESHNFTYCVVFGSEKYDFIELCDKCVGQIYRAITAHGLVPA